jgi:pilus assembly protein TadC
VSLVPDVLAATAVAVALLGPVPPDRVLTLAARRTPPAAGSRTGLPPQARRIVSLVAALALWLVVGGVVGVALGGLAAAAGPRLLGRLDDVESDEAEVARELPLALDLLAACLVGGAPTVDAVRAVAAALTGPCAARLARVGAALEVGSPPSDAWRALGEGPGPAGAAARALSRAADGGAPVAAAVARVAADARREAGARAERAARRAGVLAVGPLGLCFLPAFLLLGVMPAIVGLASPLLTSISH